MYHLQKLENISGRHLTAYVLQMQEDGKSPSTIKTDLAAIRFFHDKMSRPKYRLPSNDELAMELERRCFGGVDRTVPINEQIALALRQQLERTPRGHKLLVFSSPWAIDFTLRRNPGLELVETLQELDTATL